MILQQISRGKEILQGNLPEKNSCTEKKKEYLFAQQTRRTMNGVKQNFWCWLELVK